MYLLVSKTVGIIIAVVVVVIVLALVIAVIAMRNGFVRMKNQYEEAFHNIDVYLKKRFDLIPNLVETVKGYAKHESATFQNVVEARAHAQNATTTQEKIEANAQLSKAIRNFNMVMENYPELKANTNFMDLQKQLQGIESELTNTRKYYNATIKQFNTAIQIFPKNIIAKCMRLTAQPYFELDTPEERQNVKVQF